MLIDLLESSKAIGLCPMGIYSILWAAIKRYIRHDVFPYYSAQ